MIIPVNATTTYNWIQNSGFDDSYGNYVMNNGFELGNTDYWTGGWHSASTTYHYSGSYSGKMLYATTGHLEQSFNNISGSAIGNATVYYLHTSTSTITYAIGVHYNDTSQDTFSVNKNASTNETWTLQNFISVINTAKFISQIYFSCSAGTGQVYIDDFILNKKGNLLGQATISPTTTPWFTNIAIGTHYPQIVDDISNTAPNSCLFQKGAYVYDALMQVVPNLASDSVTNFTLYALDASGSGGAMLEVKLHYSDGTWSSSTPTALTGSWVKYNFTYLIVPHKIIDEVFIKPSDYTGSDVYVDTISLLSINPITQISFSFDLSPSALWINSYPSGFRLMGFGSFENQAYTATCIMYNNSVPTGNGTFLVTSSLASYSGVILNGIFSFNIAKRSIVVNNTRESFIIDINSDLYNSSVVIEAMWYKLSSEVPAYKTSTEKANQFVDAFPIMLIMAIFIIPATYYLGVGGFVGGFSVASIVCVWTGIAPPWFIAVTVLTDVVMIFFATRQKNTASEM